MKVILISALVEHKKYKEMVGHRACLKITDDEESAVNEAIVGWERWGWLVTSYDVHECNSVIPKPNDE